MPTLVLIRHGQSAWNLENRFTGWTDVDLSEQGRAEAAKAGLLLREEGHAFDLALASVLKRAIRTLWLVLEELDQMWLPQQVSWRLNERHYGALQGLDKAETAARHGAEQVRLWRRGFDQPPPPLDPGDPRHPRHDPRYAHLEPALLPGGESLKDTLARVMPHWYQEVAPALRLGRRVVVAAHGNSLRALCKHLLAISDQDIPGLEIPTGNPLVFDLDHGLGVRMCRYLDDSRAQPLPG
ncbi:MAG: 2,3-diphosphoglycerate-dependent phosphoglycerate mutase [Desulfarculus sp.]|nr:2,3-diphosphoglycerate-dependent phosphoglycerate mutase [Desulfarculus sp.]